VIDARELRYAYPGRQRPAIDGLGFEVGRGEIFGLLGPNGAGKSTTQRVLIGLLRGFTGEVSVLGREIGDWGPDLYEHVGVAFEAPNHYLKLTAAENLRYFGALYRQRTLPPRELLELVGLARDADVLVSQFSKGMKTRLGIARALLNDPELLFLDEPTTGLDPVSARRLQDLIRRHRESGRTVFLTTHDMSLADELCDRVAFVVEGRIEAIGPPRQLRLQQGERRVRVEYAEDGATASREFPLEGLGDDAGFLELLRTREIQTIHTLEASLEEVFVRVTGRSLT
jgi:fluoroquinolone transport system ATP-binding protein